MPRSPYAKLSVPKSSTKELRDNLFLGDCREIMPAWPSSFVDLVVTSPPYADSRKRTYGGVPADGYVEWFLPIAADIHRVLKPEGSFVLNIKERTLAGERHTFVLELILAMRRQGWLWTEEYIWHKKNCYPGKWPNRFRDAWERCLHFTKQRKFKMFQKEVMVPTGTWAVSRLRKLSQTDKLRDESKVLSGFGKNVSNWVGRDRAYPTNVLHLATECSNRSHSAAFPKALPAWFIKLFTEPNDLVFDPFMGSGTTALAALDLRRRYLGTELQKKYLAMSREAIVSQGTRKPAAS
jgi:site-specific DNA-methyltransferase (adenine-specific)